MEQMGKCFFLWLTCVSLIKVPLDPFEKDATTELDTFKETLGGAQKIHERYTPGSTNIAGWKMDPAWRY